MGIWFKKTYKFEIFTKIRVLPFPCHNFLTKQHICLDLRLTFYSKWCKCPGSHLLKTIK